MSPDGTWIVSASDDNTLKIWEVASGTERAVLVLNGAVMAVAADPSTPAVACGDRGGGVHFAHLVGLCLGPLPTTATVHEGALKVRCPACREPFGVDHSLLGFDTTCPQPACGTNLRINPFVQRPLPPHN